MTEDLPYSQACENNKEPIADVLDRWLPTVTRVLELGGGTGQHAVHFATRYPHLTWQASDVPSQVGLLNLRLASAGLDNLPPAVGLDVDEEDWPVAQFDAVFSANSLHIVAAESVVNFIAKAALHLNDGGLLLVYGPFRYQGAFTSESNARFDDWLRERDPVSGVRDFEWVNELAQTQGLTLAEDNAMPANNQLLVWQKQQDR